MIRIGILGCSEIAFRRFMPAAKTVEDIKVMAVAEEYDKSKLPLFCETYGIEAEEDFHAIIRRDDIDAVYIPQPPALHYQWAKEALDAGKHVLIEKPSTMCFDQSKDLVELAEKNNLALHENYMFQYHSQISEIIKILEQKEIGDIRLIRANFGFPMRAKGDFRYHPLGGGASMDAAGYAVKLACLFLGDTIKVDTAKLNYLDEFEVDIFGSASLSNDSGMVCQIGFGMDCFYQCNLEVWGSLGKLSTNRIFTAPEDLSPIVIIETADGEKKITLGKDSHFKHSIEMFVKEVGDMESRKAMYKEICMQAKLIEDIRKGF